MEKYANFATSIRMHIKINFSEHAVCELTFNSVIYKLGLRK